MAQPARAPKQVGRLTDHSGSIASGSTAQPLIAYSNTERAYLLIQNIDGSHDLWVNFDGTVAVADQPSILVPHGTDREWKNSFIPDGSISIIGGTTGQKFVCKEG